MVNNERITIRLPLEYQKTINELAEKYCEGNVSALIRKILDSGKDALTKLLSGSKDPFLTLESLSLEVKVGDYVFVSSCKMVPEDRTKDYLEKAKKYVMDMLDSLDAENNGDGNGQSYCSITIQAHYSGNGVAEWKYETKEFNKSSISKFLENFLNSH